MASVSAFPRRRTDMRGAIHVMTTNDARFEIGHESASGSSWGSFETFDGAQEAVVAAHRLNRNVYGDVCEVVIHPDVLGALPVTPGPTPGCF